MSYLKQTLPDSGEGAQRDDAAALLLRDMLYAFAFRLDDLWWVADRSNNPTMAALNLTYEHCLSYGLVEPVDNPRIENVHFFRFTPAIPETHRT
jgi:hypothetical protein